MAKFNCGQRRLKHPAKIIRLASACDNKNLWTRAGDQRHLVRRRFTASRIFISLLAASRLSHFDLAQGAAIALATA